METGRGGRDGVMDCDDVVDCVGVCDQERLVVAVWLGVRFCDFV